MLKTVVLFLYNLISIPVYAVILPFVALFNKKFSQSLAVRRRLISDVRQLRQKYPANKLYWIHSASMGEFEQARPVISYLKQVEPDTVIFATFMSPSGYEARKNYPDCHAVQYIPLDFFWQVSSFYRELKPDVGLIIRYEFWPNLILLASRFHIKLFLLNASLKENQQYGKWYFKWFFLPVFQSYHAIITVSKTHTNRFRDMLGNSVTLLDMGDSRFDQVVLRSQHISDDIRQIKSGSRLTFVMGSAWPADLDIWLNPCLDMFRLYKNLRLIIVPHEIHDTDYTKLAKTCSGIKLSKYSDGYDNQADIIWFDVMGKLMQLYSAADLAYVGGGFGAGVHNILEPGVYGIPVCYGSNFQRSPEAVELNNQGITTVITSETDAKIWLQTMMDNSDKRTAAGQSVKNYILRYSGVSQNMVRFIQRESEKP